MDVKAASKVEDDMSDAWMGLIDEEEDALLNEAVSHTIRQLSAEMRLSSTKISVADKPANEISDYREIDIKLEENWPRIKDEPKVKEEQNEGSGGVESLLSNRVGDRCQEEDITEKHRIKVEEEISPPMRKRPREDSVNSLPAKTSRNRSNSTSSSSTNSSNTSKKKIEYETDPGVLARRQKDIDYGKNTIGYDRYIQLIPKKDRAKEHPKTPQKYVKYSRRGWEGMVKLWRKQLHAWDPPEESSSSVVEAKHRPSEG